MNINPHEYRNIATYITICITYFLMKQTTRPIDEPVLKKQGVFVIALVSLYAVFFITVANPNLSGNTGEVIFASVLGGILFAFFLMFSREVKQWKKIQKQTQGI